MQWTSAANGGFTSAAKAWLVVNPNFTEIHAAKSVTNPQSVYHYFRKLLALRKQNLAWIYGDYYDLDQQHPSLFCYSRTLGDERFLMVLNFSKQKVDYELSENLRAAKLVTSNYDGNREDDTAVLNLKCWEARVYKL